MELLNQTEISLIAQQCGHFKVLNWSFKEFENKVIGNLGDHLNLTIEVESNGTKSELNLFVKCMPRFNVWKAEYIKELMFFKKEYVMLSRLFKEFENLADSNKWRPKLLFIKEDIFVFENVSLQGYKMSFYEETMTFKELEASVATLARFHAQSYIFEERKSKELDRPYRIWEDYSEYLQEPCQPRNKGMNWRNTGTNAVIDFLIAFSEYRSKPNFKKHLQNVVPDLYDKAIQLMKPSSEYRNVVVHRDLWTNNIFLKQDTNSDYHALFIDFQTVIYCSPMLDLSSLIYFNSSRKNRTVWKDKLIDFYYTVLSTEVTNSGFNINDIIDKDTIVKAYDKSIVFALTQAGLITPIVTMKKENREKIFANPETSQRANFVSRSNEFIEVAKEDDRYRTRVTELLDEMVERYVFPDDNGTDIINKSDA